MVSLLILYLLLHLYLFSTGDLLASNAQFLLAEGLICLVYYFVVPRISPRPAILTASLCALVFLVLPTTLSTDVYRYLWDGSLSLAGRNPYSSVPQSETTWQTSQAWLFSRLPPSFNTQPTPYPPLAQAIFAVAYFFYSHFGFIPAKFFLATPAVLSAVLLSRRFSIKTAAIFLLNPLVLLESFNGAHIDTFVMLFMLASLTVSPYFLFLAIGTKIFPVFFVPLFVANYLRQRKFTSAALFTSLGIFVTVLSIVPASLSRYTNFAATMEYFPLGFWYLYHLVSKSHALLLCALACIFISCRFRSLAAIGICLLFFSPVVYPWYVLYLIPISPAVSLVAPLLLFTYTDNQHILDHRLFIDSLRSLIIAAILIPKFLILFRPRSKTH